MSNDHVIMAACPIADTDFWLHLHFRYTRGRPEVRYLRNGDPGYPADPAEVELVHVELEEGMTLPPKLFACIEAWAAEYLAGDGYEPACEMAHANLQGDPDEARDRQRDDEMEERRYENR